MSEDPKDNANPDPEPEDTRPKVKFRCTPEITGGVELGTPSGALLRIEAGEVHEESDPSVISDLDQHPFVERAVERAVERVGK